MGRPGNGDRDGRNLDRTIAQLVNHYGAQFMSEHCLANQASVEKWQVVVDMCRSIANLHDNASLGGNKGLEVALSHIRPGSKCSILTLSLPTNN